MPDCRQSMLCKHTACMRRQQVDGGSNIVTAQLIVVLASLLKLGWLESTKEERNAFFAELESIVAASDSKGPARRAWARILVVRWRLQSMPCYQYTVWHLKGRVVAPVSSSNDGSDFILAVTS